MDYDGIWMYIVGYCGYAGKNIGDETPDEVSVKESVGVCRHPCPMSKRMKFGHK